MATTVDPYKVLADAYAERTKAINAQNTAQEAERKQREQAAQQTLTNSNRGVYTTYQQAINPYGGFASRNNFSSGVSDYYKNASYGTMLSGIGQNQYNYNDAINNSNTLWNNWVAEKAGLSSDALEGYNDAVIAQQNADRKRKDEQDAAAQAQANWEAEQAYLKEQDKLKNERQDRLDKEAKEQQDKENDWAERELKLKENAAKGTGSGSGSGSGGGGGNNKKKPSNDDPLLEIPNPVYSPAIPNVPAVTDKKGYLSNNKNNNNSNKKKKDVIEYKGSGVKGKVYKIVNGVNVGMVDDPYINPSRYSNYGH